MSVTFHPDAPAAGWRLNCAFTPAVHATYDHALAALEIHNDAGCGRRQFMANYSPDDAMWINFESDHPLGFAVDQCVGFTGPITVYLGDPPELNVSNGNAALLLESLGITGEDRLGGSMPAGEFSGRVLLAQAIAPPDEGMPTHDMPASPGGLTIVYGGRPIGYLHKKLVELQQIAAWATEHETTVSWG